mmetsp:Transcript_12741/g.22906  ORF Transcript_12741/g.22906 Transcript_12741/m.22906 type:complete len:103 (-) Transcript_12741:1595-1903(-)
MNKNRWSTMKSMNKNIQNIKNTNINAERIPEIVKSDEPSVSRRAIRQVFKTGMHLLTRFDQFRQRHSHWWKFSSSSKSPTTTTKHKSNPHSNPPSHSHSKER